MTKRAAITDADRGVAWQPIETAPRDGTWILIRGRNAADYPMIPVVCRWATTMDTTKLEALKPCPTATGLVSKWHDEWLVSHSGHWGDKIEWGSAREIARRIDDTRPARASPCLHLRAERRARDQYRKPMDICPDCGASKVPGSPWPDPLYASPTEAAASGEDAEIAGHATFLLDRIAELDWSDFEQHIREWDGHVEPAIARLRTALNAWEEGK